MSDSAQGTPKSHTWDLSQQCLSDSRLWFPGTADSLELATMGLMSEAGEFGDIVKKVWRGSKTWDTPTRRQGAFELADVYTYMLMCAGHLKVDLESVYRLKRRENQQRFGGK